MSLKEPERAGKFMQQMQDLIAGLTTGERDTIDLHVLVNPADSKAAMTFFGSSNWICLIKAFSDVMTWELVAVDEHQGNGQSDLEDANAGQYSPRFYRVVTR